MTHEEDGKTTSAAPSDEALADKALELANFVFTDLITHKVAHGESLHIRIGVFDDEDFVQLGETFYGTPNDDLRFNTSAETGKLATVGKYRMDSAAAYERYGDKVGEDGPKRWKGGVYRIARVWLPDGTLRTRAFGCAASGVEGSYDAVVAVYAVSLLVGMWEERELAQAKTAESTDA